MIELTGRARAFGAVAAVALALGASGVAQAACYNPEQQLPAQTVADFIADPARFLAQYPTGGAVLIAQIRDLVASDPATLQLIITSLTATANPEQLNAIGLGLGQAALVCLRTDQAFATEVQNAVATLDNNAVTVAFASVLGDRPTAALGGGGGVSTGGSGGQTNPISGLGTSNGGPSTFANTFTRNVGTNLFTAPSVGAGGGTTTTTTVITIVSPTQ